MLGLDHEVDGRVAGGRGLVGDHHDLGRPGERGRHADDPRHLLLGQRHIDVAGPDDDVDRLDRLGAVGQRRDGLGPTDPVDAVDVGEVGGGQRLVGHGAVSVGWDAQHHPVDTGLTSRHRRHEHRGRVAGPATGHVTAGGADRHPPFVDGDTIALVAAGAGSLRPVEGLNGVPGHPQGVEDVGVQPLGGGPQLLGRHVDAVDFGPVEASGELPKGRVAPGPDVLDDGAHGRRRLVAGDPRPGQIGRGIGQAASVQHGEKLLRRHDRPHGTHDVHRRSRSSGAGARQAPMTGHQAQLASLSTALDELTERVTATADEVKAEDEELALDLYEVERSLRAAGRRLGSVVRRLR